MTDEEIHWRDYYAVLSVGYLVIYKEGLTKSTRVIIYTCVYVLFKKKDT